MARDEKMTPLPRIYAWFSAVVSNDTDLLDDLLAHGVPIDIAHPLRHSTALMEATRLGRAGLVQWLLERGASPAFLCGLPLGTSLHCALRRHHWDVAQILTASMSNCAVMEPMAPHHCMCCATKPRTGTIRPLRSALRPYSSPSTAHWMRSTMKAPLRCITASSTT